MTQGPDSTHDHAADTHQPGPSSESDDTQFNWRIHHPFEGVESRVAVEVAPWRGLLPRWRFVISGDYKGVQRWGIGPSGTGEIDEDVKRPAKDGPVQMINGPLVVWFGGNESLSSKQSAYLVFEGEAPHYVAFGQAEAVGGAPDNLEGISFGDDHPVHPGGHDPSHGHEQSVDHSGHDHDNPISGGGELDHSSHDHGDEHAGHDHSGHNH